jgi:cation diffusion facilitator CzcD-associated flavoprotein CzcO
MVPSCPTEQRKPVEMATEGAVPDGFCGPDDLVHYFERYAKQFRLPVQAGIAVTSVEQAQEQGRFLVRTTSRGQAQWPVLSHSVVIASGFRNVPSIRAISSRVPGTSGRCTRPPTKA